MLKKDNILRQFTEDEQTAINKWIESEDKEITEAVKPFNGTFKVIDKEKADKKAFEGIIREYSNSFGNIGYIEFLRSGEQNLVYAYWWTGERIRTLLIME
jgi:hypothetical protein